MAPAVAAASSVAIDMEVDSTSVTSRPLPRRTGLVVGLSLALAGAALGGWMWLDKYGAPESAPAWVRRFGRPAATTRANVASSPSPGADNSHGRGRRQQGLVVPVGTPPPASPPPALPVAVARAASGMNAAVTTGRLAPEIVQTPVADRARVALSAGQPDDAIAVLRPSLASGNPAVKTLLAEALVASGWKDAKVYRWNVANRKAREALQLTGPNTASLGAHALLGEALYAAGDFSGALAAFNRALVESPRDARLKRRVIRSRRGLRPALPPPEATAEE